MRYLLLLAPAILLAAPARYARIAEFSGTVEVQTGAAEPWIAAERNAPLPESARVRTGAASRVELELDEGSAFRLGSNAEAELSDYTRLSTGQRITLISVSRGIAYCTGAPEGRDSLVLVVPGAQVAFTRPARVRVEVEEQWSQIAMLKGAARFASPAAELELRENQTTRVEPANSARFFFFKEVIPGDLDQWSAGRDDAPLSPSAAHTVQRYGLSDLDGTGEWILTPELGAVWRPKVDEDWRPYRDGKWRWYDGLGYTWIAAEPWGWLPYHYGRWTRPEGLGWVWAPSKNGVFKPGDVYWLRGAKFTGWGPLAPGEQWDPADSVNAVPQLFLHSGTTYATFRTNEAVIDPAGFKGAPKDPLKEAEFLTALPSPPFASSRLDATRPIVNAAVVRVKQAADEWRTTETAPVPAPRIAAPPPAPVVIVTQPASIEPQPPPAPEIVGVPVAVPVAISVNPKRENRPAPKASAPVKHGRQYRTPVEAALVAEIVQKLERRAYDKALVDLDQWAKSVPDSEFAAERTYYYMLAYNGLDQPGKVVHTGAVLLPKLRESFEQPMQALSVVYLICANYQKLPRPPRELAAAARNAASQMLALLPTCFTQDGRPQAMSDAEWAKSRTILETLARDTMARAAHSN
jgi:hypothetical protein